MSAVITKCENCGRDIGKLETPSVFDEHVVCTGCYESLRAQRARARMPIRSRSSYGSVMAAGASLAVLGAILAPIGYKMLDPAADQYGVSQAFPRTMLAGGVFAVLIGMLVYAWGRYKNSPQ